MVWKRPRRPFAGGAGSRRRAPGFECHGSRPAFRGPRNMETDGIMRKEDGLIRHKENGAVRFRYPCRESNPAPSFRRLSKEISRSRTVRRARKRGGRPDPTSLDPACHPVLVSMVRGKGFPRRAHAGCRTRRRPSKGCQRRFQGVGRPRRGSWAWGGAPRGRRSSRRDGSRRDVVSDSRQSLSSACGALRRRETAMRAAPPPSTTTAASAISAMPAPVWARLLR